MTDQSMNAECFLIRETTNINIYHCNIFLFLMTVPSLEFMNVIEDHVLYPIIFLYISAIIMMLSPNLELSSHYSFSSVHLFIIFV